MSAVMRRYSGVTRSDEITNSEDTIESRDLMKRIDELNELKEAVSNAKDDVEEARGVYEDEAGSGSEELIAWEKAKEALARAETDFDEDLQKELKLLEEVAEEASGYSGDWRHGATLIRESYFEDYAMQFAEDLHGNAVREASWPFDCINWEQAADALKGDYTGIDFDGVTYYVR